MLLHHSEAYSGQPATFAKVAKDGSSSKADFLLFFFIASAVCVTSRDRSCVCLRSISGSQVHSPCDHWENRSAAEHWLTWAGELKPSLCLFAPQNCCHHAFVLAPVAVVCLSFCRCSASRWARTWRGCTAASPPPTSPSLTLMTCMSCGTSASREATGSGSTSATSAWNLQTAVNMTTSRYTREPF